MATHSHVDFRPSTAWPIVVSAPHGGFAKPNSISDRTSGCLEPDWNSLELAREIIQSFLRRDDEAPAFVALLLHREKIDGNRPVCSACEEVGAEEAQAAWRCYHGGLARSLEDCVARFGFCLLLDIHGQSHRPDATELGYLLTSTDLLRTDAELDADSPRRSSVDSFLKPGKTLSSLIRGEDSLGSLLGKRGCVCTPSPFHPAPVSAEALQHAQHQQHDIHARSGPPHEVARAATYFWGGYSIRRYAVADTIPPQSSPLPEESGAWNESVAAIQLETAWSARQSEQARRVT